MLEFAIIFALCYVWHALGVTVGYHRLISHRSFSCPKWLEYFWVLPGYLAFEGSPIWWSTIHRAHHRHVDTALDPHSPQYGVRNAHIGWLLKENYAGHIDPVTQAPDLMKDPVYRFLEQGGDWQRAHILALSTGVCFRIAIFFAFGWIPALASALAGLAVLQIPLMLNVVCHLPKFGYQPYATDDDSVNVWWVAILSMGEGWHNNHHSAPGSAKTGMRWWEVDASWLCISAMNKLGLVDRLNVQTDAQLHKNAARMAAKRQAALAIENSLKAAVAPTPTTTTELISTTFFDTKASASVEAPDQTAVTTAESTPARRSDELTTKSGHKRSAREVAA